MTLPRDMLDVLMVIGAAYLLTQSALLAPFRALGARLLGRSRWTAWLVVGLYCAPCASFWLGALFGALCEPSWAGRVPWLEAALVSLAATAIATGLAPQTMAGSWHGDETLRNPQREGEEAATDAPAQEKEEKNG